MRIVVQRVNSAKLCVGGEEISRIGKGLVVMVGVCAGDDMEKVKKTANKISSMRIFEKDDKMDLSVLSVGGEVLLVSNFTLCTKETSGARPDFTLSADKDSAKKLYLALAEELMNLGVPTRLGVFGADMQIQVSLDGPITIFKEI